LLITSSESWWKTRWFCNFTLMSRTLVDKFMRATVTSEGKREDFEGKDLDEWMSLFKSC
jgi:hypothetical protein